jgi:hypothetical protein
MGTASNVMVGVATLEVKYPVGATSWVNLGYTEDGTRFEYAVEKVQIKVEEKTYPISQVITGEQARIIANLAEETLTNIYYAMAGASKVADVLTIGGAVDKELAVRLTAKNPSGGNRVFYLPVAVVNASVTMSFRKNEKTIVPVTFEAIESPSGILATITDS